MTVVTTIYKTESRRPKFRRKLYTDRYSYESHTYINVEDGTPCVNPMRTPTSTNKKGTH